MAYIQVICTAELYIMNVLRVWEALGVAFRISRDKSTRFPQFTY
jgi:hypothetical protein